MDGSPIVDENGEPSSNHINFVRGFAYDRAKMVQPGQESQAPEQEAQPETAHQVVEQNVDQDDDIDF